MLFIALTVTATTASAEGITTKLELEKGFLILKARLDTSVLPPGDGAYRAEIHFHTHEVSHPQPCFDVVLKVDTLNFKMSQPNPEKGISKAVMKVTDDGPDDKTVKVKIVQENPPASQIVVFHLFSTDPFTGNPSSSSAPNGSSAK